MELALVYIHIIHSMLFLPQNSLNLGCTRHKSLTWTWNTFQISYFSTWPTIRFFQIKANILRLIRANLFGPRGFPCVLTAYYHNSSRFYYVSPLNSYQKLFLQLMLVFVLNFMWFKLKIFCLSQKGAEIVMIHFYSC